MYKKTSIFVLVRLQNLKLNKHYFLLTKTSKNNNKLLHIIFKSRMV